MRQATLRWCALAALSLAGCTSGGGGGGGTTADAGPRVDGGGGDQCTNTCDAEGAAECRAPGFRTCGDQDGDGCLEWSPVQACMPGWSCVTGQCVNCINDCEPGSVQCGANGGVRRCAASGDEDPCFEFAAEEACPAGQSCSAGQCRPVDQCVDECAAVGATQCSGGGVQTCEDDPNTTCRRWSEAVACAQGETCTLGECKPADACVDECENGSARCRLNGYETCGNFDDDACAEWSAVIPCEDAQVCSQGRCAADCSDECGQEGQRQCSGNGFQVCGKHDEDPCLEWGNVTPCEDGQACSAGQCRAACVNECAEGSRQCAGNGVQRCGNFDGDDCLEWSEPVPCDAGENCSNGACAAQCSNECGALNQRQCAGNSFQVCANHDEDACLEWGVVTACPGGQTCAAGACAARCANECVMGSAQCVGQGVQRCGNFDEDECTEWSAATPCGDGESCSNGACAAACGDECRLGATRCAPGGLQTCGDVDDDPCSDWGPARACPEGQFCSNGACAAVCSDECARGARRCTAGGVETCGQFDGDPCVEWSAATPCADGQVCSNGQCAATCSNECAQGSLQCAGNGFQTCGQFDGDACVEWSEIIACQAGTSCSDGVCGRFCSDECAEGASRCGGGGVQVCGQFDADACREWGSAVPCPAGQACAMGACAAQCNDECAMGATRCGGGGVQQCGDFDADVCREWSAGTPCGEGEACSAGACLPVAAGCAADAECPDGFVCAFATCVARRACQSDGDCAVGERCGVNGACRRAEASGVGANCTNDAECGEGQFCLNAPEGACSQLCDADVPCPLGTTCYTRDDDGNSACLADCADAGDCAAGQACYPSVGALGGACFVAACTVDADCATDPVVEARCDAGVCVQVGGCDLATGEGCAAGTECVQYEGFGLCLTPCNVFGAACPAGERCQSSNGPTDAGYCIAAGGGGANQPCATPVDCAAGLTCVDDGLGNSRCLAVCDTDAAAPCPGGAECLSLGGRVGACSTPCESECLAGATRCTGDPGTQSCGQTDDDLCLEWEPTVRCAAGEGCDEALSACAPACAADADCQRPLIETVCVEGSCLVDSQCNASTGAGCDAPEACYPASDDGTAGVCLEACDPVARDCSGGELRNCGLFGGSGFCVDTGFGAPGGFCLDATSCGFGSTCVNVAEDADICLEVCDLGDPNACPGVETCLDLGVDGVLGVCYAVCEDACVEGAQRCGPDGGVQVCGRADPAACLDFGPSTPCGEGLVCDPETNACVAGCSSDLDCDFADGVTRACVERACAPIECTVGQGGACGAVEGGRCVSEGLDANGEPSVGGFCLTECDPLSLADCGLAGACTYYSLDDESTAFVCLPASDRGRWEPCEGVGCQDGFSCLFAFEDDLGNPVAGCLERCAIGGGCSVAGDVCTEVGFFPAGVGVCLPE